MSETGGHWRVLPPNVAPAVEDFPGRAVLRDVLALPGRAGLYREDGSFIAESSALVHRVPVHAPDRAKHERHDLINSPPADMAAIERRLGLPEIVERPALYLGNYHHHYGHFLTDWSARLWAHFVEPAELQRVWGPMNPSCRFDRHVSVLTRAVDLSGTEVARPRLFREIVLPDPAFQTRYRIHRCADRAHLKAARRLLRKATGRWDGVPVYLSRGRLEGGYRALDGEARIEALFADRGFRIVHPETLPLPEQAALFNASPVIAGLDGSAFHTGMFSLPAYRGTLLILAGDASVNTRLVLQGMLKGYETVFVDAFRSDRQPGAGSVRHGWTITPNLDSIDAAIRSVA